MPTFTTFKGSKDGLVKKSSTTLPDELTGDKVLIKITASGLCYTDIHYKTSDMVLGHEGVGVVEATGPDVKQLKKGDRVGWGYEHDSCGLCKQCLTGQEIYCADRAMYADKDLDQGSFASQAVWREAFLFKLPDALSDEAAAPLMCGGATVWSALTSYNTRPTETVGILGVGGLGHLAIQFCAHFGCRVVVLSGSDRKRDEALRLGAHEFVAMKDASKQEGGVQISHKLDRLLVTTSAQPDWSLLMSLMQPGSTIHPLSVSGGNFSIPYMPLLAQGITVQGSIVAPRQIHKDMLDFAALHGIKPVTQEFPMTEEGIREAMDRLEKGEVHFRAVLKAQ